MAKRWRAAPARLDLGRLGRRRRARPRQPDHAREGAPRGARGRGRDQLLPQPAPRLSGRHLAEPAPVPAASRADRGPRRQSRGLLQRPPEGHPEVRQPAPRRRVGRRPGDALVAVLHPVGLARARGRRVRRRRRRCGRGRLLQRLSLGRRHRGAEGRRRGRRQQPRLVRAPPRLGAHGVPRRAGPRRARRRREPSRPRVPRRSTATRSRRSWRPTTLSWSPATCC